MPGRARRTERSDAADVGAAYDSRAVEYLQLAGTIEQMEARDRELIASWRDGTRGPLLDAGCGPGHWTAFLAEAGRDVSGVDVSAEFVRHAREQHRDLPFHHRSFARLPIPDAGLGGILAWYSLIHLEPAELPVVLREFARVLRPGGSLLIGFFDGAPRERFAHAVAPAWFWSAETLGELLEDAGFAVTSSHRRTREDREISVRPHADLTAVRDVGPARADQSSMGAA